MRIMFFLLLFVSILFPMTSMAATNPDLDEGMKQYYQKQWELAKGSFAKVIAKDPLDSLALSYYFACFLWTDSVAAAVGEAEEEYVKRPDKLENVVKVAFAYYAMGQIDLGMQEEAKTQFKELINTNPDKASGHTGLGLLYNDKRLTPRAKAEFIKALSLDPEDIMSLEHLGIITMLDDSNPEGAITYFKKIVDLVPNYPDGQFYMGSAYYKLGKYDIALPYLQKTSELDPLGIGKGYFSTILTGDIFMKLSKYAEAVEVYKKAVDLSPENIAAKAKLEKAQKAQEENK